MKLTCFLGLMMAAEAFGRLAYNEGRFYIVISWRWLVRKNMERRFIHINQG